MPRDLARGLAQTGDADDLLYLTTRRQETPIAPGTPAQQRAFPAAMIDPRWEQLRPP